MHRTEVFVLLCIFFLSCSGEIKLSDKKLIYLGKIDYLNYDKFFIAKEKPALLIWKDFLILKRDLSTTQDKLEIFNSFKPEGLFIKKGDGKILIPQSIEDLKYSPDGKYIAFVMRLGNSMNTTVGIADATLNKIIYSFVLKEHPPVPGRKFEFVAFENVFTNPVFSDDSKFLACDVFNYLNKRLIRLMDIISKKYIDLENAIFPCFINDKLYFIDIDMNLKKTYISSYDFSKNEKTKIKIKEITEYVLLFKKTKNNAFLVTRDNIFYFDKEKKDIINIMSLNEVKNNIKNSEIMRVFIENYGDKEYVFLIIKKLKNNQYIWELYGKILKF